MFSQIYPGTSFHSYFHSDPFLQTILPDLFEGIGKKKAEFLQPRLSVLWKLTKHIQMGPKYTCYSHVYLFCEKRLKKINCVTATSTYFVRKKYVCYSHIYLIGLLQPHMHILWQKVPKKWSVTATCVNYVCYSHICIFCDKRWKKNRSVTATCTNYVCYSHIHLFFEKKIKNKNP